MQIHTYPYFYEMAKQIYFVANLVVHYTYPEGRLSLKQTRGINALKV